MGMHKPVFYYFSKWVWDEEQGLWEAPNFPVGRIDFRSDTDAGKKQFAAGYGLFVYSSSQTGLDFFLGNELSEDVSEKLGSLETLLNLEVSSIESIRLVDVIFELLTMHGETAGLNKWKSLLPNRDSLVVKLAGQVIKSEKFIFGKHQASNKVLGILQENYRIIRNKALDIKDKTPANQHRKYLGWLKNQFNIKHHLQFIPIDLPNEIPVQPETTVTDDFNRANENIEASADWALLDRDGGPTYGSMDVLSNQVRPDAGGYSNPVQNQNALSGTDMEVFIEIATLNAPSSGRNSGAAGARVAQNTAGIDGYFTDASRSTTQTYCRLLKKVNGTTTVLDDTIQAHSLPDTIKISVNGSTIESLFNDIVIGSVTDTSITSGLLHGIEASIGGGAVNDVIMDDYTASDIISVLTERGIGRGVGRGIARGI